MERSAGILLPIFSLPSKYGIGSLGAEAIKFIDFLKKSNQKYWQILPLGPTNCFESPYQTLSSFAGNPYFIDLDLLVADGLLSRSDLLNLYSTKKIDYSYIRKSRINLLKKAFSRFKFNDDFHSFIQNENWLKPYAVFMVLKQLNGSVGLGDFKKSEKTYNNELDNFVFTNYKIDAYFYMFVQYIFFKQWFNLKAYANSLGIYIIGDMPIYTSYDSSDVFTYPQFFQLDTKMQMTRVAGCPPDDFAKDGQLWGNPLYNYHTLKKDNYSFLISRVKHNLRLFDFVRIDHFRGFESYYSIPSDAEDATCGKWIKGPGMNFFKVLNAQIDQSRIIAEDLGFLTEEVHNLLAKTSYPGMKVMQFAFNHLEDSQYLLHNHTYNSIVYTGTHDNPTLLEWFDTLNEQDKLYCIKYMDIYDESRKCELFIKRTMQSVAKIVIIPIQDYLGLRDRINTPSTIGDNWNFILDDNLLNDLLAQYIKEITVIYRRNLWKQ